MFLFFMVTSYSNNCSGVNPINSPLCPCIQSLAIPRNIAPIKTKCGWYFWYGHFSDTINGAAVTFGAVKTWRFCYRPLKHASLKWLGKLDGSLVLTHEAIVMHHILIWRAAWAPSWGGGFGGDGGQYANKFIYFFVLDFSPQRWW